jgi:hypothetical protein
VDALVLDVKHARAMAAGAYRRGDAVWVARWNATHDDRLSDLAARARNGEELAEAWTHGSAADVLTERLKAAEADRDRLRDELAHVENELDEADGNRDHLARRVAKLEAALYNHGYGPRLCRCEWCAALAGDGGGA